MRPSLARGLFGAAAAAAALAAAAAPAGAATTRTVSAAKAAASSCPTSLGGAGKARDSYRVTAPYKALVRVTLNAPSGDWDLGVFGAKQRRVAGSAAFGADGGRRGLRRARASA